MNNYLLTQTFALGVLSSTQNSTADQLLVVFTGVSAIAACVACIIAARSIQAANGPDVVVYLEADTESGTVRLCVGNFGNRTAHDISISLSEIPQVDDELDVKHLESFTKAGITTLPPGTIKRTLAGEMSDSVYSDTSKEYIASVSYSRKSGGMKIKRQYSLDYRSFCEALDCVDEAYL